MSEVRAFAPTFGAKKEATVSTTASSATLLANAVNGPVNFRIVNNDTVRVAYRFGDSTVSAVLASDPSLPAGAVEIITVIGKGVDIYFSVIGDTGASGAKFEACPGQGI